MVAAAIQRRRGRNTVTTNATTIVTPPSWRSSPPAWTARSAKLVASGFAAPRLSWAAISVP